MNYKHILVAGAGRSGIDASKLIARNHIKVTLFDENKKGALNEETLRDKLAEPGVDTEIDIHLGELTDELMHATDVMVISPGISTEAPFAVRYKETGKDIIGEIELAFLYEKGSVCAITGTNGKTTTTTLVGEIIAAANPKTYVVGNIGTPYTGIADTTDETSVSVAEISSFQLETCKTFRPHVSAVLNLTPDHLDRHHTFENYADCKFLIGKNQTADDVIVLNADDPEVMKRADSVAAKKVFFSATKKVDGAYIENGDVKLATDSETITVMPLADFKLLGSHNIENLLASVAITYYMGVDVSVIAKVCAAFKGVAHRIEYVRTLNDVDYYNDSKGTNPDAAIKGIKAMTKRTYLIGGGYDKQIPFDDWIEAFDGKVAALVLIGQTADIIENCARAHGFTDVVRANTLEEAIDYCKDHAKPGEAVLLSPACASWGMFDNYEQRGDIFRDYVNKL